MSLSTAENAVRRVPPGGEKAGTLRAATGCRRRHRLAVCLTLAITVAATGGRAAAEDFKSLLAAAGTLVFGEPVPQSPTPAAPPQPSSPAPLALPAPQAPSAVTKPTTERPGEATVPRAQPNQGQPNQGQPNQGTLNQGNAARAEAARVDAARTGRDAELLLQRLLPPRSDTAADWYASAECLHAPGEPRSLKPCVPPPPCDPSQPPQPYDLVGVAGVPSGGPIYRGPCEPRSSRKHEGFFAWYHQMSDHLFDHFYRSK